MILHAGRCFDARRDIDAERPHAGDRLGHVFRRQPAGEQNLPLRGDAGGRRPVDRAVPCRRASPDRGRRRAASCAAGHADSCGSATVTALITGVAMPAA